MQDSSCCAWIDVKECPGVQLIRENGEGSKGGEQAILGVTGAKLGQGCLRARLEAGEPRDGGS